MSKSVLLIDDSLPLHKLVKTHLEPEALTLHSAHEGESGLTAAAALHPDLILLDVDMPGMDGFEVCRRLKANPPTAAIPVVFLTADGVVSNKVQGLDIGAADYVTKPFKPEELRARVRAALRDKNQLDKTALVDGLTGLWNRAYLDAHLAAQLSLSQRSGRPLGCVMAEVDRFSELAARHGDAAAFSMQQAVGRILQGQCRAEDIVCRLEGGQFAILAPGSGITAAGRLADRLRGDIERQLKARHETGFSVTCSLGVSDSMRADDTGLIARTATALARARRLAGNSVCLARRPNEELGAA